MNDDFSPDNLQQSSPVAAAFITFVALGLLAGVGYGTWKVFKKREAAQTAEFREALRAEFQNEREAAQAGEKSSLTPYRVDPKTGKLDKVETVPGEDRIDPKYLPQVGEFELTERSGKKITQKDLSGQPWAVCFVFTRCWGPCLKISSKMMMLQKELKGSPVRLVTITVDPKYDTPEVLKNYADNFGADPERWLFLTGEADYVYPLLRKQFLQLAQEMTGKDRSKGFEVFHSDDILHVDAQGRIVKRYHGTNDEDMVRLRMALLAEAEQLAENASATKPAEETSPPAIAEKPTTGSEK